MPRSPVTLFFVKVLLWLPVIFAAWYFMAIVATWPVTYLVKTALMWLFPDVISLIKQSGYMVEAAAYYTAQNATAAVPQGVTAELVFEVNALSYGYCVPLYTALILATPSEEGEKWFRWVFGMLILQFSQAWGVSFDILKSLLFNVGPEVAQAFAFSQWQLEAVALGYQFGYLVVPAVTPVVVWMAFHSDYLKTLAPNLVQQG
ncbi:MAG: hypothetical protein C0631_11510 [Sedimenticola sp.]|jgi:hypothetical protein|nr:MAG: hypothetical protein C0631_11510 [Sedimenticola sp.]